MIQLENYLKMTYKETLLFIGKCLTISHEENNLQSITKQIKSDEIDWDSVVKVSTAHYVFPALYCNLKRANLLSYLPEDLVSYMKHITDLNRERNIQIIDEAKEINELLTNNGITPIFLKGTGFLLQDFYEDIAERMVGDIDFIVSPKDYEKTIKKLLLNNYSKLYKIDYDIPKRHYPRLIKQDEIAAVEIHKQMILDKYTDEFNFHTIKEKIISKNNISFLSLEDQLSLTAIAIQINDNGQFYNNISLRNAYDTYLLSTRTNSLQSIINFDKLFSPLNNFLGICNEVLSSSIHYKKTQESEKYKAVFYRLITNQKFQKQHSKKWKKKLFLNSRLDVIYKSIYRKDYRYFLLRRITDKTWYKEKMVQIGLKSSS